MAKHPNSGKVYLIGAGPGDPKLLTIKGLELLRTADTIVYDRLASAKILENARPDAEQIFAGKSRGSHSYPQDKINKLLIKLAKQGKIVARLKGGDPFVFGRGGEEALALTRAGIPFEVVPGVSAGVAVPAYAGIPVTHRGFAASVAFITGHEDPSKKDLGIKWKRVANSTDTLVFFMGMQNLELIVGKLLKYGRAASEPVAIIRWGTTASQTTVKGQLKNIVDRVARARLKPPCIIVVGKVASLSDELKWFEDRPLTGKKIVITRSRDQASEFAEKLESLGAETIIFPTIKIVPPADIRPLDKAIKILAMSTSANKDSVAGVLEGTYVSSKTSANRGLGKLALSKKLDPSNTTRTKYVAEGYDWIVFTSVNAVEHFFGRMFELGMDIRTLGDVKLAAVGKATAAALKKLNLNADLIAKDFRQEGLLAEFKKLSTKNAGYAAATTAGAKQSKIALTNSTMTLKSLKGEIYASPQKGTKTSKTAGQMAVFEGNGIGRVLIPRAKEARTLLETELAAMGADVDVVVCYENVLDKVSAKEMQSKLEKDGISMLTFTSSSTVTNFITLIPKAARIVKLEDIKVACIGPVTADTAAVTGLPVDVMPAEYTIDALVDSILKYYKNQ